MQTNSNKDIGELLKKYGYAMPLSEEEVIAFENKFNKNYELPSEWSSIDNIIEKDNINQNKIISLNDNHLENGSVKPLSMAAREGKEITGEIRKRMNKDKKDVQK
ncbi:hypothetical protein FHS04_000842 [Mesoflavibacter sabulilitoris]|uniref:Uncharacterized protein n=1 Tax=Mesoflavibacter zeaxanthinifaciens subsp. sabulilitoris TaxID=1520893 RepID=A0A2T1N624_9FLAO|nr:hypothetical protein [Mesoflavibacter zeaxanthinifaciens]MBB3123345.1 hypothetical protein [Mesoflavibacter zeaxanthinifaciens subsp. sabulilitoris]PSG87021.1 hypothetical protein C7H61_12995 [Mesoflavibacter zeaxanthinifaciens subsp. sabulilitoris]